MRYYTKLILIAAIFQLHCKASELIGNLAFYGRGQRHLPNYWSEIKDIIGTDGFKIFFPFNESDEGSEATTTTPAVAAENEIVDNARNYPLVLYIPGKKDEKDFSYVTFKVIVDDKQKDTSGIDLSNFHKIKSEMKMVQPKLEDIIEEFMKSVNMTNFNSEELCQSLNIDCTELKDKNPSEINFEDYKDEWAKGVDVRLYLESDEINNDSEYDEEDKEYQRYEIENFGELSTEWSECSGDIIKKNVKGQNSIYNNFTIRNYGILPTYLYIGNTIFLKKESTYMVKEGIFQNQFQDWSWHKSSNTANKTATYYDKSVYEGDPEKKNCIKFIAKEDGDAACYVHIAAGISAPPEGVSFRLRPMNDNQFKFKIDNKKEFNLTYDYLIHRNCKIPLEQETEFLVDVRSLVYSDPKFMLMNDISGFWVQTISRISNITQEMRKTDPEAADSYTDVFYFYDFILHHTYPEDATDKTKYVQEKLFEEGEECRNTLETHKDWENPKNRNEANPVIAWPDDIDFETIYNSKNSNMYIPDDEKNSENTEPTENKENDAPKEDSNDGTIIKPIISLCLITTLLFCFI